MTWVFWWPVIPLAFLLLGRFWCAVCPFGAISDVVQKWVGNNRPVPRFLKNYGIWIIDAFFILITWGDHVFGIVNSPRGSGVLLLMIITGVVAAGAFFERRAWCRYLCFLGGLSGNYSRAGMLELRGTPEKCAKCRVQACYKGGAHAAGCPMFEFPRHMDTSAECNLCGNCIKSCPHNAIKITPRVPSRELWFIKKPRLAESFLAVIIMGIVFVQNITMLDIWQEAQNRLEQFLRTDSYFIVFTVTFLIAMLIPLLALYSTSWLAGRINRESGARNFTRFGYALIPLDLASHVAHNLFHLLAEGKAVVYTFYFLIGLPAGNSSPALVGSGAIQLLQFGLVGAGLLLSLYTVYRIAAANFPERVKVGWSLVSFGGLLLLLAALNVYLFTLPMSMRTG